MDLSSILIISLIVVVVFSTSIIIYLNVKASKIKKQVLSGTYVSTKKNSNNKNIDEKKILEEDKMNIESKNIYTEDELKKMTVKDLKELMKYDQIKFNSIDTKKELIEKILKWYEK